jgi:hypothetical protein
MRIAGQRLRTNRARTITGTLRHLDCKRLGISRALIAIGDRGATVAIVVFFLWHPIQQIELFIELFTDGIDSVGSPSLIDFYIEMHFV